MKREVFVQGKGLASALGSNLPAALAQLATGGIAPGTLSGSATLGWPYFGIADDEPDWLLRTRKLITQSVAECGITDRTAALFLASCSINIGAIETSLEKHGDCLDFGEAIARRLNWLGPVYWISTACTSASNALLAASANIASGHGENALVLGVELRNRFTCGGFAAMQLLDTQRPRPLAADRNGLVLGEAVAALWLGTEPGRWRLAGGANIVDGRDPAGASAEAVTRMTHAALANAGLHSSDIGLIKLQAAGSLTSDGAELDGLRAALGELPALTTLKAEIGHTLGASGAAELALLCACIEHGIWVAPRAAADPALNAALSLYAPEARFILSNILGFGGGHATLILEDCA